MSVTKVLVADDEPGIRELFSEYLQREGFAFYTADDGEAAMEMVDSEYYDVAIIGMNMPKANEMAVLKYLVDHHPNTIVIISTGYASIRNAVEAIKAGAYDYLPKPVRMAEVPLAINRALEFGHHEGP